MKASFIQTEEQLKSKIIEVENENKHLVKNSKSFEKIKKNLEKDFKKMQSEYEKLL